MRFKLPLLSLALVAAAAFPTSAQVSSQSYLRDTPSERCPLNVNEAPVVRDFKLGMPKADVLGRFKLSINLLSDEFGFSYIKVEPNVAKTTLAVFEGVSSFAFEFTDDKLSYLEITYLSDTRWEDTDEFLSAVQESLKLPGRWRVDLDPERPTNRMLSRVIQCQSFNVRAGLESALKQIPFLIIEDTGARDRIAQRKIGKAKQESEARKKTFKP